MKTMQIKRYGYIPDLPDFRDYEYSPEAISLPPSVDLRFQMPGVYDQGQLGSCTGNSIAGLFHYQLLKQKLAAFIPSRLLIYYDERVIEGTVKTDSGAQIRDGLKVVATKGVLPETLWPYIISKFAKKPSSKLMKQALQNLALQYNRLDNTNITTLKTSLANGICFVFGFTVYESFETAAVAQTGIVPMPGKKEQVLGGHAVMCVGYDDSKQCFIVRNSWGSSWGLAGYFYFPYAYMTNANLVSDVWNITQVN